MSGPTSATIADFLQMVVDHKVPVIVMLTLYEEKAKVTLLMYAEPINYVYISSGIRGSKWYIMYNYIMYNINVYIYIRVSMWRGT